MPIKVVKKDVLPTVKEVHETISTNVAEDLISTENWVCISVYEKWDGGETGTITYVLGKVR